MKNFNAKETFGECLAIAQTIKHPVLKTVCLEILNRYEKDLSQKPATSDNHHSFKGGLLYHTHCVAKGSLTICDLFPQLAIDRDLVVFGALLHDIGKVYDYEFKQSAQRVGNNSVMLGHSYRGTFIVETELNKHKLDDDFKHQVLHVIACHMKEFANHGGALVLPKMKEVMIINFADHMSSYFEPAIDVLPKKQKGGTYQTSKTPHDFYKSLNPHC
ncbi:MAG: HD domain-containing protein [Firmicutes bacterium]|nr:HD domain-containing protein [Bacillota bacterium]